MTFSEFKHIRSEYARQLSNLEDSYQNKKISDTDFKVRFRSLIENYLMHTRPDDVIDTDVYIIKNGHVELKVIH